MVFYELITTQQWPAIYTRGVSLNLSDIQHVSVHPNTDSAFGYTKTSIAVNFVIYTQPFTPGDEA